ncbi:uncharacterized protein LOC116019822 [Ipomoea triloba]|uniref:uncharacterized protein LOC116019822 n=1 Tax=Ipomoea triloba TaxID=35885 RepID=UPI00125D3980|nr:uncharacterized protein LOC116019822 [Ipomoea triloba]
MNIGSYASTMATAPERPQPLHNFFLSQLRWGHNSTANHRFRRRDSHPHPNRHRSVSDGGSDSDLPPPGSQPRFSPSPCSAEKERPPTPREPESERNGVVVIPEEGETRTWNLRPRKASLTASLRSGEMAEAEKSHNHMPKSQRLRGIVEGVGQGQGGHQWLEKKRKLWISLSKEEIEEDVYSLTGSRPARRPKKRPRNVQKLVNNVLPGLYLAGLSVDSYRAHESQM